MALIDRDPAKRSEDVVAEIEAACDAVVRLPHGMAIERAILAGAAPTDLRAAASVLSEFGHQDRTMDKTDDDLAGAVIRALHSNGLHEPYLTALIDSAVAMPPVVRAALVAVAEVGVPDYVGPSRVDLSFEPAAG